MEFKLEITLGNKFYIILNTIFYWRCIFISPEQYLSVSQFNKNLARYFNGNPSFKNVYVRGEVSKTYVSPIGHLYFDLKDKNSKVPCIVYKNNRKDIGFDIEKGMKLLVIADIGVYWPHGKYQLDVKSATEDGLGKLYVKLQQLKRKLKDEGLFDDEHKKELPRFPKAIGVVTSKGGSVIHDIIKTVTQKWPYCQVLLFPAAVQGASSKSELVRQIRRADSFDLDVLIVARGGGSPEELWSFNEEEVVRAIFNCNTPVISAIGHEDDVTLSDMVADVRASTPTMAASLAIEDKNAILDSITHLNSRLVTFISSKMDDYKRQLDYMLSKPIFKDSTHVWSTQKSDFDELCNRFDVVSNDIVKSRRAELDKVTAEYVIRHPCKMQLDSSTYDLNELQSHLFDSMNFIINDYRVNLDKVADNFGFLSQKLLTSRRHELEMIESYFVSNPCQNSIDMSKNNLKLAQDKVIGSVNVKLESDRKDLELMSNKFRNASNEILLKNRHKLDSIRNLSVIRNPQKLYESQRSDLKRFESYFMSNPYQSRFDSSRNDLKVNRDKLISIVGVKMNSSRNGFDLTLNRFANASNDLILRNSHKLDSIRNSSVIRNPQRLCEYQRVLLESVKDERIVKNPYMMLDRQKRELDVYREKLDKIGQVIELKKEQERQKAMYLKTIVAIVIIMIIILILIFGGI